MADAIGFDTHRFVKNLTASSFTEAQTALLVTLVSDNPCAPCGLRAKPCSNKR